MCLKDPLSDTNPLIQKQRNKTQTLIKKDQAAYPQKKKKRKKEEKKKTNPKIQTVYPDQNTVFQTLTSTSSLQLHSHTNQNTVFQINKQTKKEIPKGSEKKGFVRLLQQGKLKNLVRLLQKQAI